MEWAVDDDVVDVDDGDNYILLFYNIVGAFRYLHARTHIVYNTTVYYIYIYVCVCVMQKGRFAMESGAPKAVMKKQLDTFT